MCLVARCTTSNLLSTWTRPCAYLTTPGSARLHNFARRQDVSCESRTRGFSTLARVTRTRDMATCNNHSGLLPCWRLRGMCDVLSRLGAWEQSERRARAALREMRRNKDGIFVPVGANSYVQDFKIPSYFTKCRWLWMSGADSERDTCALVPVALVLCQGILRASMKTGNPSPRCRIAWYLVFHGRTSWCYGLQLISWCLLGASVYLRQ